MSKLMLLVWRGKSKERKNYIIAQERKLNIKENELNTKYKEESIKICKTTN
jgi:hypothetical protein